jgi:hypothetical protein
MPHRKPHWVRPNETERIPHRWIVADTETRAQRAPEGQIQRLRLGVADFWRDDLASGDAAERFRFTDATAFWAWVISRCSPRGRTCLAFHNAGFDLAILDAFTVLPQLGAELAWCNLDRDVSVTTWRTPGGTLITWDTYTWCPAALDALAPLTGIAKPRLPRPDASDDLWWARCEADVDITKAIVSQLLHYIKANQLGNWQPSGASMGHTTWRHKHYTHKVLVHDDQEATDAERAAMHTGRAEAWWHGVAAGGPFTEWDMRMSYTTIAAQCDLPAKLWETDNAPSRKVHQWALDHWRVLAEVEVETPVPVVPVRHDGRTVWPVGRFHTTLWDTELSILRAVGGRYRVLKQWRYTKKPILKSWAQWSITQCALDDGAISLIAKTWVKHQARAVIGRMALRTPTWERYSDNWIPGYTGISHLHEEGKQSHRLMHVGNSVWYETDRQETHHSVPQVTSWIMAEGRARLWNASLAAGQDQVLHCDTDSIITTAAGTAAMHKAVADGLPGQWRPKTTWRRLEITGPRHYHTPDTRQIPGIPCRATDLGDGTYAGEVWDSLARSLTEGRTGQVTVRPRTWRPQAVDHRRPWDGTTTGPAQPITLPPPPKETAHDQPTTTSPTR